MLAYNLLSDCLAQRFDNEKRQSLKEFCNLFNIANADSDLTGNYFADIKIPNGLCAFDLLRFYDNRILNIQLITKYDLSRHNTWEYIDSIMRKNYFYLKYLNNEIICYCYCYGDGIYKFNHDIRAAVKVDFATLCGDLRYAEQSARNSLDVAELFNHTKFLISPFSNTAEFMNGEYCLSQEQQEISNELLYKIASDKGFAYCLYAIKGSGKTMLVYDTVKRIMSKGQNALIIHGGGYNDGHLRFKMQYDFDICTIKEMAITLQCLKITNKRYNAVFVDDAQCFNAAQLDYIANVFLPQNIPVILAVDTPCESIDFDKTFQKYDINIYKSYIKNNIKYKTRIDL